MSIAWLISGLIATGLVVAVLVSLVVAFPLLACESIFPESSALSLTRKKILSLAGEMGRFGALAWLLWLLIALWSYGPALGPVLS